MVKHSRLRSVGACLFAALLLPALALAEQVRPLVIDDDDGGRVDQFLMWYGRVRAAGIPVRVRGLCVSACTLVLSLPREQICIEPTASFGFHLFAVGGRPDMSATQAHIRRYYPAALQAWLKTQAELTPAVIYMSAAEAVETGTILACGPPAEAWEVGS